jgi:hypothetical protein
MISSAPLAVKAATTEAVMGSIAIYSSNHQRFIGHCPLQPLVLLRQGADPAYLSGLQNDGRHEQEHFAPAFRPLPGSSHRPAFLDLVKAVSKNNPKPDVRVPVVWIVPVANGAAQVLCIVVERTAPQHPRALRRPHTTLLLRSLFSPPS